MVKNTQTIRRQTGGELFECVEHFVGLALKGLRFKGLRLVSKFDRDVTQI